MSTADQSKRPLRPTTKKKTPARYDPPPHESVGGVGKPIDLFPPPQDEENLPPPLDDGFSVAEDSGGAAKIGEENDGLSVAEDSGGAAKI